MGPATNVPPTPEDHESSPTRRDLCVSTGTLRGLGVENVVVGTVPGVSGALEDSRDSYSSARGSPSLHRRGQRATQPLECGMETPWCGPTTLHWVVDYFRRDFQRPSPPFPGKQNASFLRASTKTNRSIGRVVSFVFPVKVHREGRSDLLQGICGRSVSCVPRTTGRWIHGGPESLRRNPWTFIPRDW